MTVPAGDPEALEHHFAGKTVLLFFCSRHVNPMIYRHHLTDFSELCFIQKLVASIPQLPPGAQYRSANELAVSSRAEV